MIVFVLMAIKITTTLFSIFTPSLTLFSASSIPMLLVWITDHSSTELFTFKSAFWLGLFALYFLVWIVAPWMTISKRRWVKIVGLLFVLGSNLFDIIGCMLSALSITQQLVNIFFSTLIIVLPLREIHKTV